jgi:hypothetical protein
LRRRVGEVAGLDRVYSNRQRAIGDQEKCGRLDDRASTSAADRGDRG